MMWHDLRGTIKQQKQKHVLETESIAHAVLYIRIDTILSKNIWNHFQNLLIKKLLAQMDDQTHILEILLAYRHSLVTQNHVASVRLHHCLYKMYIQILHLFFYCFSNKYITLYHAPFTSHVVFKYYCIHA